MRSAIAILSVVLFAGLVPARAVAQSSTIRLDRLERLANYLDTKVPATKFNILCWGTTDNPDDPEYVGCAAGYATLVFRQEGFHYKAAHSHPRIVVFDGKYSFEAIHAFFGIDQDDSYLIFTCQGGAGTNPHKAAANIRAVIARERRAIQVAKNAGPHPTALPD
jgi:hypothetical protein